MPLELKNVEKTYLLGKIKVPAIRGISLRIKDNEFLSITGESGSGKSTLLNLIGCLDTPTVGTILIDNQDISKMTEDQLARIRREKIGFIFQKYNLIAKLSALENVTFPMWLKGVPLEQRTKHAEELLKLVGLGERFEHRPSELSGGESQRVAIARALANKPTVLLADEPTGNLDSKTSADIMALLKKIHKKEKTTLVLITHDHSLAKQAKHKIHLKDGVIIKEEKR